MSQHQKENIVSLISTLIVSSGYIIYIINRFQASSFELLGELKFWATAILILIPIRILIQILVTIIFTIVQIAMNNGKEIKEVNDERDRLIELQGDRVSSSFFIMGFVFALLIVAILEASLSAMFIVIFIFGYIGELAGISAKLFFYHRGIR